MKSLSYLDAAKKRYGTGETLLVPPNKCLYLTIHDETYTIRMGSALVCTAFALEVVERRSL